MEWSLTVKASKLTRCGRQLSCFVLSLLSLPDLSPPTQHTPSSVPSICFVKNRSTLPRPCISGSCLACLTPAVKLATRAFDIQTWVYPRVYLSLFVHVFR